MPFRLLQGRREVESRIKVIRSSTNRSLKSARRSILPYLEQPALVPGRGMIRVQPERLIEGRLGMLGTAHGELARADCQATQLGLVSRMYTGPPRHPPTRRGPSCTPHGGFGEKEVGREVEHVLHPAASHCSNAW